MVTDAGRNEDYISSHPGGEDIIARLAGQDATEAYETMHNPELVSTILPPTACKGDFDTNTASALTQPSTAQTQTSETQPPANEVHPRSPNSSPSLSTILSTTDFEPIAKRHLSPTGWAYYASGADDMHAIADPVRLWRLLKLRPRILRNVTTINTPTCILNHPTSLPFYISPTGLGRYAHPDAECALARAAGREGIVQVVPTAPSRGHEEIVAAGRECGQGEGMGAVMMFQLYFNQDRNRARAMIERAERLGYAAIWVTVDSPVLGKREMDERLKVQTQIQMQQGSGGSVSASVGAGGGVAKVSSSGLLNPGLTWEDIQWMRSITPLPVVLKGVQSVEDAVAAWEAGLEGIVLSNHGGRSMDAAQAPLITLLEIRRYAPHLLQPPAEADQRERRFEVYIDGGVRRGTDVIKALALGCTAVGVGRPFLYSMCGGYGEEGARRLIAILRAEIETNMALLGVTNVCELRPEMVNSRRVEMEVIDAGLVKL